MIEQIRVHVGSPVNQDTTTILITMVEKDSDGKIKQSYVQAFLWAPYHGFDLLDISNITFPATRVVMQAPNYSEINNAPRI